MFGSTHEEPAANSGLSMDFTGALASPDLDTNGARLKQTTSNIKVCSKILNPPKIKKIFLEYYVIFWIVKIEFVRQCWTCLYAAGSVFFNHVQCRVSHPFILSLFLVVACLFSV